MLGSLAASVVGAFGATRTVWVLGQGGAVGQKAHANLLVERVPLMYADASADRPRLIKKVAVQAFARPRQRVTVGYVLNCDIGGRGRGVNAIGVTPFTVHVTPQLGHCKIYADATLSKKGRLTVRVIARRA